MGSGGGKKDGWTAVSARLLGSAGKHPAGIFWQVILAGGVGDKQQTTAGEQHAANKKTNK